MEEKTYVKKITISLTKKTAKELEKLKILFGDNRSRVIARLINETYTKLIKE